MKGLLSVLIALTCGVAARSEVNITYALPDDGRASLVVFDEDGAVVRELLHAVYREAGASTEAWDCLDEQGKPVPAGRYTWKLLLTHGLRAEYLLTLGTNPTPRWDTWPGNHNGITSIAVDGAGMYLSAGCSEGPPQIIKQSFTGERVWSAGHVFDAWQGGVSAAVAEGKLYELQANGAIIVLDPATGERRAKWDVLWVEDDPAKDAAGYVNFMDLDAHGEQIVVSYKGHDAIRWLDPKDGAVLDEAPVPEPQAVAVDPSGRVLVVSRESIVAMTRADKTPKTIAVGLTSPWRLDVEDDTGDILLAEKGESQQVKRFSKDGKLLKTYGTPGGRKQGRYDPMGFADVRDIAADQRGGFLVCEGWSDPKRTAWFDKNGSLIREWYGGGMYANHGVADPADPTLVWVDGHFGGLVQTRVDYANKTWQVIATYRVGGLADGLVPSIRHGGGRYRVRHHEGRTYLLREDNEPTVLMVDEPNGRLVPMVASDVSLWHDWEKFTPQFIKDVVFGGKAPENARYRDRPDKDMQSWHWTDLNGDGAPQPREVQFNGFIGWDFGKWHVGPGFDYYIQVKDEIRVMPLLGWTDHGAPVYGGWDAHKAVAAVPKQIGKSHSARPAVWRCPDGVTFACFNTTDRPFGLGFVSSQLGANRVVKWDKAGKVQWVVGRHSATLGAEPGEARIFQRIIGAPHGCVAVGDMQCYYELKNMVHVWDQDGLWVGRLLEAPDLDAAPESAYRLCTENFGGSLYTVKPEDNVPGLNPGDVVFFGSGQNNTPVFRVTGWDTFKRQSGSVAVSRDVAAELTGRAEADRTRPDLAHIRYIKGGRARDAAKVDGDLAEWEDFKPLEITDGKTVVAKLYLGWNSDGLSAAFDVIKDRPWRSSSSVHEAFTGGAAVDVQIGPLQPERTEALPGDARFVAAPIGGETCLVEFLPRLAPGMTEADRRPQTYQTGQGKVTFERVAPLPAGDVAAKAKEGGTGYVIEMRVPLRRPLLHKPGQRFRFDASVILASPEGDRSEGRLLWHSKNPADMMVSADIYHECLLRPQNWGEAVLE